MLSPVYLEMQRPLGRRIQSTNTFPPEPLRIAVTIQTKGFAVFLLNNIPTYFAGARSIVLEINSCMELKNLSRIADVKKAKQANMINICVNPVIQ